MSQLTKAQNTTPVYIEQPGEMTHAQPVAIAAVFAPSSDRRYSPPVNSPDLTALAIPLVLLAGLAFAGSFWLFSRPNAQQQQLAAENARLNAQQQAIAGCVTGVMGGQR